MKILLMTFIVFLSAGVFGFSSNHISRGKVFPGIESFELSAFTVTVSFDTIKLSWATATEINSNRFEIERQTAGSGNWTHIATIQSAGNSNSPKYYTYNDLNIVPGSYDFRLKLIDNDGSFTYSLSITTSVNPLPVELTSFSATVSFDTVNISWRTATEINAHGFGLERKNSDSVNWLFIGTIRAAGHSTSPKEYNYLELNVLPGSYSYRLKMVDFDGSFFYSSAISVSVLPLGINDSKYTGAEKFRLDQNYPNPFNPATTIAYSVLQPGNIRMVICNTLGQDIKILLEEYKPSGQYKIIFDAAELHSGVYFYRLESGNSVLVRKMVIVK